MDRNEIKKIITSAFRNVRLGDGIGLWEAQGIDDYAGDAEQKRARHKDEKRTWSAIEPEILDRCYSSLSFFDANGMRFHLPAFLISEIDGKSNQASILLHLTKIDAHQCSRFASLSIPQREAIKAFLHWCLEQPAYAYETEEIQQALKEYWDK